MRLEGIHHISAITGDAPRNVDFYARVLGLRLVKQTVNQDDPSVYHLFYADEQGSPGADLTFFEYPGARPGRAGAGMVHRIVWRVASPAAIDFWAARLGDEGVPVSRSGDAGLRFADPEGLEHELVAASVPDAPLVAAHREVPAEHALQGFHAVRAFAGRDASASRGLFEETLGFAPVEGGWESRGESRGGFFWFDDAPEEPAIQGAGTVHHVAWSAGLDEIEDWQARVASSGAARPTPVVERFYFRSVYFREPNGVLFELATRGPGFATDEPADQLGERLSLPPRFEPLRDRLKGILTPLPDTRAWRPGGSPAEPR